MVKVTNWKKIVENWPTVTLKMLRLDNYQFDIMYIILILIHLNIPKKTNSEVLLKKHDRFHEISHRKYGKLPIM